MCARALLLDYWLYCYITYWEVAAGEQHFADGEERDFGQLYVCLEGEGGGCHAQKVRVCVHHEICFRTLGLSTRERGLETLKSALVRLF